MDRSLDNIADALKKSERIAIFPHVNPDGDAVGTATALCVALRMMGKSADVIVVDEIPLNLRFMTKDDGGKTLTVLAENYSENPDISLMVDCSSDDRIGDAIGAFKRGKVRVCIDHHLTPGEKYDMSYIDSDEAATAQIGFKLIKCLGIELNEEIAKRIYAGIVTDTGGFKYPNTQKKTHLIASELFDTGFDHAGVCIELFENSRLEKLMIEKDIYNTLNMLCDDKVAICGVTQDMLMEFGAEMSETDDIVGRLKSIDSVEVSCLMKEEGLREIKVSLRSKSYVDVSEIAKHFGGGGHKRAAGFTMYTSMDSAYRELTTYLEEVLGAAWMLQPC